MTARKNDVNLILLTSPCAEEHHRAMRTTLNLEDDVLEDVKRYAEQRRVPLGKAVSDLVRRGLNAPYPTRIVNGWHVAVLPPDSPKVTTEHVLRLLDELE